MFRLRLIHEISSGLMSGRILNYTHTCISFVHKHFQGLDRGRFFYGFDSVHWRNFHLGFHRGGNIWHIFAKFIRKARSLNTKRPSDLPIDSLRCIAGVGVDSPDVNGSRGIPLHKH